MTVFDFFKYREWKMFLGELSSQVSCECLKACACENNRHLLESFEKYFVEWKLDLYQVSINKWLYQYLLCMFKTIYLFLILQKCFRKTISLQMNMQVCTIG